MENMLALERLYVAQGYLGGCRSLGSEWFGELLGPCNSAIYHEN
jgi:hypothetical protein